MCLWLWMCVCVCVRMCIVAMHRYTISPRLNCTRISTSSAPKFSNAVYNGIFSLSLLSLLFYFSINCMVTLQCWLTHIHSPTCTHTHTRTCSPIIRADDTLAPKTCIYSQILLLLYVPYLLLTQIHTLTWTQSHGQKHTCRLVPNTGRTSKRHAFPRIQTQYRWQWTYTQNPKNRETTEKITDK